MCFICLKSLNLFCPATSMLCTWFLTIAGGIAVLCVSLKIFLPYFWEDLIYFLRRKRSKATVKKWTKNGIRSLIDLFVHTVDKKPHKPFLIYEGTVYTYQDVDRRSNRVAQAFLHYGNLKKGDTVALLMGSGPDFIHVWFGLAKLGFVVAFLNTSIHSRSLLHCINTCAAKALVIGEGKFCVVFHLLLTFHCFLLLSKIKNQSPSKLQALYIYTHLKGGMKRRGKSKERDDVV